MTEWIVPLIGAAAAVAVAVISNWVAFRQYKRRAQVQLQEEARLSLITEEQLQAEFRKEIREEMRRLRDEDERRTAAYRKLEDENSDLRRQVASLEIEVMRLKAQLTSHVGPDAPPSPLIA